MTQTIPFYVVPAIEARAVANHDCPDSIKCDECDGAGVIEYADGPDDYRPELCHVCDGDGVIDRFQDGECIKCGGVDPVRTGYTAEEYCDGECVA